MACEKNKPSLGGVQLLKRIWLGLFLLALMVGWLPAADTNSSTDLLASLRPSHPRLLATANVWEELRAQSTNDVLLGSLLAQIEQDGRAALTSSPLTRVLEGKRLLAVSRQALDRITLWAFCHRITGEAVFLKRAQTEMLALAAFEDWNPSHFLDTAEMTAALAIGYDWLYADLDPTARTTIRRAIVEKGLRQAVGPEAKFTWWRLRENNWNQVCYGGLTLGALAVADEEPSVARRLLEAARQNIVHGLRAYAPDGVYPEGPGYWNYGTTYQVLMIAALESALGDSWNLDDSPGFLPSASAQLQLTGPTGKPYNFADGGESVQFMPSLFWFAQRLQEPDLLLGQSVLLNNALAQRKDDSKSARFLPLVALWWNGGPRPDVPVRLPLAWLGDGLNPVGVFRSSWADTNALYLAFKGGSASLSHAHMDAGSFILEADGVRWACDLGAQDYYSLESKGWNPFAPGQDGVRWRVYRLNNFSHSTLTVGGQLHRMTGDARIVEFNTNTMSATVDLTKIFAGLVTNVVRRFQMGEKRSFTICDELSGLKPGETVRWQMVTRSDVKVDRAHAVLRQNGKALHAQVLSPSNAKFQVVAADPPDDGVNAANPNTRILVINVRAPADGRVKIEVRLRPEPADTSAK